MCLRGKVLDAKITLNTVLVVDLAEVVLCGAVRDIEVMLDGHLPWFHTYIEVKKSCFNQIRSLSKIQKYLTKDSAKSLNACFCNIFVILIVWNLCCITFQILLPRNFNSSKTMLLGLFLKVKVLRDSLLAAFPGGCRKPNGIF